MTQEKTRLKFRVSAHDGVSAGGMPEPRWTEKWGVGLFDYEEFHVTDQLLKLPFQEATPKTVCVFSISGGALSFRLLDGDRHARVNGVERRDAIITTGDKILIGDTLTIEVALAPPKTVAKVSGPGPAFGDGPPVDIPKADPEEGPTLTFAPTGSYETERPGMATRRSRGPDLSSEPKDIDFGGAVDSGPSIPQSPIFADESKSIEIQEPSFNGIFGARPKKKEPSVLTPRPSGPMKGMEPEAKVELQNLKKSPGSIPPRPTSLSAGPMPGMIPEARVELEDGKSPAGRRRSDTSSASAGPMRGMEPEGKIELADGKSPTGIPRRPSSLSSGPMRGMEEEQKVELADHAGRDGSLDERSAAMADLTNENIKPLYPEEADLGIRTTFGERILAAIARLLRRDDFNPPEEPFADDSRESSRPWFPDGPVDPGFAKSRDKTPVPEEKAPPKPWIPEFISAASRIRGRAFIFLVAAIGTLMIAVGVFRIQYRIATLRAPDRPDEARPAEDFPPSRGIPIEIIEDKVRRMRAPRR